MLATSPTTEPDTTKPTVWMSVEPHTAHGGWYGALACCCARAGTAEAANNDPKKARRVVALILFLAPISVSDFAYDTTMHRTCPALSPIVVFLLHLSDHRFTITPSIGLALKALYCCRMAELEIGDASSFVVGVG